MIAEAHISGPGLDERGPRICAPATEGMWESGIYVVGALDDARADSIAQLGLTTPNWGPRYVVTYRFVGDYLIRQDLYPYAKWGR